MDWIKVDTDYYLEAALMRAGEAAEVLWMRAKAYCGGEENDGLVPREVLPRLCPTRSTARAAALVREGLWSVVPRVGWRFVTWDQLTAEQLAHQRAQAAARQARSRTSRRDSAVSHGVTHARVTGTEVEEEVDAAAAAGAAAAAEPAGDDLDGRVAVLRDKLRAHTPLRGLRFDTLTADQTAELAALLEQHGDDPLVTVAIATCRHPAPTHASAFIGTWRSLPPPGKPLAVVRQQLCQTHGTRLTPSGACSACAADQKAGDR